MGEELGRGKPLEEIIQNMNQVAEGVHTAGVVVELAEECGVEMPISQAVNSIISGLLPPNRLTKSCCKERRGQNLISRFFGWVSKTLEGRELSERQEVEKWFIRKGLPHLTLDYKNRSNILRRAAPFLALVYMGEVVFAFGNRWDGLAQAAVTSLFFIGLLGSGMLLNVFTKRPAFSIPRRIGLWEGAIFVLIPAFLSMLSATGGVLEDFFAIAILNLLVIWLTFLVTSYGVLPMLRWSIVFMFNHLRKLINSVVKSVPLLLLFATFIFLNAEVWQVASDMNITTYILIVGLIILFGLGFIAAQLSRMPNNIVRFESRAEVLNLARQADSPLKGLNKEHDSTDAHNPADSDMEALNPELPRRVRLNVWLLLSVSSMVRFFFVGLVIGSFYTLFGFLAIRESTIGQWITEVEPDSLATWNFFGAELFITSEHLWWRVLLLLLLHCNFQ